MKKSLLLLAALGAVMSPTLAPAEPSLDAARVELIHGEKTVALSGSEGLFDRVFIPEKKTVRLRLALPAVYGGQEVSITAPNGGQLARLGEKSQLRFTPPADGPLDLELEFTPTLGRGAYTIAVRQGGAVLTLDLWSGEPNPIGQPGPAYVPVRNPEPELVP